MGHKNMKNVQGRFQKFWLGVLLVGCIAPLSAVWASTVNISSMLVNNASLTVAITGYGTFSFSRPVVPVADILMGQYQPSIYTASIAPGATAGTAMTYSTGAYGSLPPSGTVDPT